MSRIDWGGWDAAELVKRERALGERFGGLECRLGERVVKLAGPLRAEPSGGEEAEAGRWAVAWREGLLRVRARDGWVRVPRLAVAGAKAPMDAASFARGYLLRDPPARFT